MPSPDLSALFSPRSVAIVGASDDPNKLGGRPIRFLKEFGYTGEIYPVNPRAGEVQGLKSYASVRDIPGEVDQAVLVVPAGAVEAALRDCAAKRVKMVQVLAAGFAETGAEGRAMQDRLVAIARDAGMRITGPNALGCVSPGDRFCATFSTALNGLRPVPGPVAICTQSGAFGSCAYVMASLRDIGLSRIIATGNEADIDVADCIAFLADDPQTRVICAAVESCQDGARLRAALARAADARKPVVIMKIGRSEIGAAAAASHTGTLAGDDAIHDVVFAEGGAVRAGSIEEMIDIAYAISVGGAPASPRTSVVTLSGGIGILLADAAGDLGLEMPPLPDATRAKILDIVPFATGSNPLDTTAQIAALPTALGEVGATILREGDYASLLVYLANNGLNPAVFAPRQKLLLDLKAGFPDRTIVAVMPSHPDVRRELEAAGVPVFEDPSRAARAVAQAARFATLRDRRAAAPAADVRAVAPLPRRLDEADAKRILAAAGLPFLPEAVCGTAEEAAEAAARLGFPVALKVLSADIAHKSEAGGVALNLDTADAVRAGFARIMASASAYAPGARIEGALVAPMIADGLELALGVHRDPVFGPFVMLGLGGVMVELLGDVDFASAPLSAARAEALISAARWSALLDGFRGGPRLDRAALVRAVVALSAFAAAHGDTIEAVELNPFVVRAQGCVALDALIVRRETDDAGC